MFLTTQGIGTLSEASLRQHGGETQSVKREQLETQGNGVS